MAQSAEFLAPYLRALGRLCLPTFSIAKFDTTLLTLTQHRSALVIIFFFVETLGTTSIVTSFHYEK